MLCQMFKSDNCIFYTFEQNRKTSISDNTLIILINFQNINWNNTSTIPNVDRIVDRRLYHNIIIYNDAVGTNLARIPLPVGITGAQKAAKYGLRVSRCLEHVLTHLVFNYRNLHFL